MAVYLYYYENGEKKKNCGYAKLTIHQEECRVELNMIDATELEGDVRLCFCRENESEIMIAEAMRGTVQDGDMCLRYQCKCGEIAGQISIEELKWILVDNGSDRKNVVCGAVKQEEIDFDKLLISQEQADVQERNEEKPEHEAVRGGNEDKSEYVAPQESKEELQELIAQNVSAIEQAMPILEEDETSVYEYDQECLKNKQECQEAEKTETLKTTTWQEKMFHTFPKVMLHINGEETTGIRLRPQDMVWFPSEYWRVATNKFLLSSYYNYRYILFFKGTGKQKGKYYLGMPGCLGTNNAKTAAQFGFPDFFDAGQESRGQLAYQERKEKFGFWCRET